MTGKKIGATPRGCPQNTFLRLVTTTNTPHQPSVTASESLSRYWLLTGKEMVIGRDPSCQIVLDAMIYRMVSRRHAVVSCVQQKDGHCNWVICDLNSANGTFVNGQHLEGCQKLLMGDRISLGTDGPQFIFEYEITPPPKMIDLNKATVLSSVNKQNSSFKQDSVSFTQLFPIISTGKDLTRKAYLIPGILTVVFVLLMFATVGYPQANQEIGRAHV